MQLLPEEQLILSVVKLQPTAEELERINNLIPLIRDWEYFTRTITDRGIAPLLFKKLSLLSNKQLIPDKVQVHLQQAYYKTFSRSTMLYEQFRKVIEEFGKQNIRVIALKGIYLSEFLYRDIGLRQFSDIDLLVNKEDGEKCLSVLRTMGFKAVILGVTEFIDSKSEVIHYSPMVLNGVSVEIHIKLHRFSKHYAIDVNSFIQRAVPVKLNSVNVSALELHDLLIHLCVHLDKHFRGGHVQFTSFSDLVNLLDKYAAEINWTLLKERCTENKASKVVFTYLMLVHYFYKATLPQIILDEYNHLLISADKELFVNYLRGVVLTKYHVSTHWGNFRRLKSFSDKIRFLIELIFPPKSFMMEKYTPRPLKGSKRMSGIGSPLGIRGHFWWLWYPYRWYVGVKGVFKLIMRNIG